MAPEPSAAALPAAAPPAAAPPAAAADWILSASALKKRFGGLVAVDVPELRIARGRVTSLIGPNGAGKSTLFNVLTGFDRGDGGRWFLDGRELTRLSPDRIARLGLVRTFQLTACLSRLSVLDNMMLGAPGQDGESLLGSLWVPRWRAQERRIEERSHELLERFRLAHLAEAPAGALSGGQRKLLEMARALMSEPRLLLLDEPMAGVNPALREELLAHIRTVSHAGTTIVLIEHDMDLVRSISDHVVCMASGRIIAEGSANEVGSDPTVIDAYLGTRRDRPLAAGPRDPAPASSADTPVLSVEELVAGYVPGVDILRGATLHLGRNEVVGIFGPNGAGKSTLLKAVFGASRIRAGSVKLDGCDVTRLPAHELVRRGIGYVPQVDNVFAQMTVEENLRVGLFLALPQWRERLDFVTQLFPALARHLRHGAGNLSGGERQMVALARALMMKPAVLLLDEPSAGLSPHMQDTVFELVLRIRDQGVAILIVEQNARRCLEICDRGYVLDQGRNACTGTGAELLGDARVVQLYLGSLGARRDGAAGPCAERPEPTLSTTSSGNH